MTGTGKINILEDKSHRVLAEIEATSVATLRFNQIYFPGWEILVDNKKINFDYLIDGESYGLPIFDMDKGKHIVLAEFKNTPVRNIADGISIVSLGVLMIIVFKFR